MDLNTRLNYDLDLLKAHLELLTERNSLVKIIF